MSWRFILGIGDGPTDDSLELNGGSPYSVPYPNGLLMPTPAPGATERVIEVIVNIEGTSRNALFNAYQEVQRKLWQVRDGKGAHRHTAGVTLSLNLETDEWAYADIVQGVAQPPSLRAVQGGLLLGTVLQLTCRRYLRGERVINALTTEAVTSGTQLYLPSVAGTAPALARLIVTDTSTNSAAINRIRAGVQGLSSGLYANDVTFTNALTAAAGISTAGDGTDTVGTSYSTITAQAEWQRVASLANPTTRTSGLYDAYLRWRDHAAVIGTPTNLMLQGGAIGIVQAAGRFDDGVTSITVPWSKPTTPGNLLVLLVSSGNVTVTATGWTLAQSAGTTRKASIYYKANAAQESGDVTITFSGSTDAIVRLVEYSGVATSTPLDVTKTATGTGNASTGASSVTSQANELAVALFTLTGDPLAPSSLTAGYQYRGGASSGSLRDQWADAVLTAAAAQTVGMNTIGGGSTSWTAVLATFKGATSAAPDVAAGTYQARVTALTADGESLASFPASVTLDATGAINLRWDAPTVGTVTGYRVYLNDGSGWDYWDTGSTATNYSITTLGSPTGTADPPVSSRLNSEVRLSLGSGTGTITRPTASRYSQVANGEWEVVYLDTIQLPPDAAGEDEDERPWTVYVEVRNDVLTPDVDIDALILRPHNECAIDAEYVDTTGVHLNLDDPLDWTLDTRRDGRTSVTLADEGTLVGGAWHSGAVLLYPGDNLLLLLFDSIGGVSDLEDVSATVRVDYTPRWDWLPGQDWGD